MSQELALLPRAGQQRGAAENSVAMLANRRGHVRRIVPRIGEPGRVRFSTLAKPAPNAAIAQQAAANKRIMYRMHPPRTRGETVNAMLPELAAAAKGITLQSDGRWFIGTGPSGRLGSLQVLQPSAMNWLRTGAEGHLMASQQLSLQEIVLTVFP